MSLFHARDWWGTQCGADEGFDTNSMTIANIDNASDGKDKIIVGSFSGVLRIFTVNSQSTDGTLVGYQASDVLLEADLKLPILQVASGLFLAATDKIHLALLHPRKLCVFSISAMAGVAEHGSSYNILLIYEHILQRSAYNLVVGPFGHVKGRDFLCVQSLDGTLTFYEQESLAFSRFLPNFLLPGPIVYVPQNDAFVVATASWAIESYRYQVLAIAKDGEETSPESQNAQQRLGKGRRATPDWSAVIGENVVDMKLVLLEKNSYAIVVLGERNLYALKENGMIWFMNKFDFSPSCIFPYPSANNDSIMMVIATEFRTLLIYCNDVLKWAAQLPISPVVIKRATLANIKGVLIFLSDDGNLSCNYLGTNPSLHVVHANASEASISNYAEAEQELQELKKIISAFNADANSLTGANIGSKSSKNQISDLTVNISEPELAIEQPGGRKVKLEPKLSPSVSFSIHLDASNLVNNIRMMVEVSRPIKADPEVFTFASIPSNGDVVAQVEVSLESLYLPSNVKLTVTIAYVNAQGAPRIIQKVIHLPIYLLAKLSQPLKETEHTISLDVVCHTSIDLKELFTDLIEYPGNTESIGGYANIGIEFHDKETPPVTVSMTAKPPQQRFRLKSDSFGALAFVSSELIRRLQGLGVKFDTAVLDKASLPLEQYLKIIDLHLSLRCQLIENQSILSKYATQFRTIQKRFLVKLKDRNPTPLNDLDFLLETIHSKIMTLGEKLIKSSEDYDRVTNTLSCATNLILQILSIATNIKQEQMNTLRAALTVHVNHDIDEGWEERTEVALSSLLSSNLKDTSEIAKYANCELSVPETSVNIRKLISVLVERIYQGELLSAKPGLTTPQSIRDPSVPSKVSSSSNFLSPTNEIIPEEDEEDYNGVSLNNFAKTSLEETSSTNFKVPQNSVSPSS